MKVCVSCNTEKDLTLFSRKGKGLQSSCKSCIKEYNKEYYKKNKDRLDSANRAYAVENKEAISAYKKEYDIKNRDTLNEQKNRWKRENKSYYAAKSAERRSLFKSSSLHKTCPRIRNIYEVCRKVSERTGIEHHVDHVVPLKGENVCGLHVWWNLRIIPASMNLQKGNRLGVL